MRVTSYPLVTLRDTPAEAEIVSHRLLMKGGYIRRISSGNLFIYAFDDEDNRENIFSNRKGIRRDWMQ